MAKKPEMSKEDREKLKKLIAQYDLADQEEAKAKAVADKSSKLKAKTCEELFHAFGAGPYIRSGLPLTIVKREWKNKETGAVTSTSFYFRGPKESEGIEI